MSDQLPEVIYCTELLKHTPNFTENIVSYLEFKLIPKESKRKSEW